MGSVPNKRRNENVLIDCSERRRRSWARLLSEVDWLLKVRDLLCRKIEVMSSIVNLSHSPGVGWVLVVEKSLCTISFYGEKEKKLLHIDVIGRREGEKERRIDFGLRSKLGNVRHKKRQVLHNWGLKKLEKNGLGSLGQRVRNWWKNWTIKYLGIKLSPRLNFIPHSPTLP